MTLVAIGAVYRSRAGVDVDWLDWLKIVHIQNLDDWRRQMVTQQI